MHVVVVVVIVIVIIIRGVIHCKTALLLHILHLTELFTLLLHVHLVVELKKHHIPPDHGCDVQLSREHGNGKTPLVPIYAG